MRTFEVVAGAPHRWDGMTDAERVVSTFLSTVRVTGDAEAASHVLAAEVECHQVIAEEHLTITRTPREYAGHVHEMLSSFDDLTFRVEDLLSTGDRVYVRWRQEGWHAGPWDGSPPTGKRLVELGSAVYRVTKERIVEYWVQLDREGFARQLASNAEGSSLFPGPAPGSASSLPLRPSVRAGSWCVVSGQVGVLHGSLVSGGVGAQLAQALNNLSFELEQAGADLTAVVKTTVFLTSMEHYEEMNERYAEVFTGEPPARTAIAVCALPGGALVEVEAWAWIGP